MAPYVSGGILDPVAILIMQFRISRAEGLGVAVYRGFIGFMGFLGLIGFVILGCIGLM